MRRSRQGHAASEVADGFRSNPTTTATQTIERTQENSGDKLGAVFERFTDRARRVLVLAQEEAQLLNHNFIGTEHILLGLIHEGDGVAAQVLTSLRVDLDEVRQKVQDTIGEMTGPLSEAPPFTPRAKKVLELALREALQLGQSYIGTEHLLLGLVREGEGVAAQVLVSLGVDLNRVRLQVIQLTVGSEATTAVARPHEDVLGNQPVMPVGPPPTQRCALCNTDLWTTAHFVASGHVGVCDDCIRTANRLLDETTPERRRLVLPPKVLGDPPNDDAVSAIINALQVALCVTTSTESRAAVVEEFDQLDRLIERNAGHLAPETDATRLIAIRFLTPDVAAVKFEAAMADGRAAYFEGRLRLVNGRWRVTPDTVAKVLFGRGWMPQAPPMDR